MTFQCLNVSKYVKHVFGMPLGLMTHAFEVLVSSCSIIFYTRWWQLKYFLIFFMFTPKIGEDSHFDDHIFSDGWSKTTNSFCLCFMSSRSIQPMPMDSIHKKNLQAAHAEFVRTRQAQFFPELHNVHPSWAGTFVLAALESVFLLACGLVTKTISCSAQLLLFQKISLLDHHEIGQVIKWTWRELE